MQEILETRVPSLDWEDSLEKEMATSSSILAWKVPWTEEPGGLQFMGSQSDTAERLSTLFFYRAGTVTLLQLKLLRKRLC